jgi:hypothetical protein
MQVQELILQNKDKVRRDSNLMSLYLNYFKEAYGYAPSCAGCSFNSDWQTFVSFYSKNTLTLQSKKIKIMEGITIKRIEGNILSYQKDEIIYRKYDNILTPEFIDGYLKNGTAEEIKERKKLFNFPEKIEVKKKLKVEKAKAEKQNEVPKVVVEKAIILEE